MPAALILDDDHEMMVVSSSPLSKQEVNKTTNMQSPLLSFSTASIPSDSEYLSDDSDMSEVDESTFFAQEQHNIITDPQHFILHAALEILNSPSAEAQDLLAVMRALPFEPHIQSIACEKLWVQSFDDDQALRLAQAEGGIPLVLDAMARFPHQVHLQHCAGEVLQNIASLGDAWFAHEICQRGGVTLLVHAMRNHPEHCGLQLCGCVTLASLAEADPNNRDHIRQVGGLDAVLYAKWNHKDQKAISVGAQQALEASGHEDDNSEV